MLDAARVQQHGRFGRSPDFRGPDDACGGHSGDRFGASAACIVATSSLTSSNPVVCVFDELRIDPSALDHHVQDSVGQRAVAAGTHRQEEVRRARDRRHARIDDDDLCAVVARSPDVVGQDREALADVRAG